MINRMDTFGNVIGRLGNMPGIRQAIEERLHELSYCLHSGCFK